MFVLSVSVTRQAIKYMYFYILLYPLVAGKEVSFLQKAFRVEPRLGKKTLQATSEVEFYSTTRRGSGELRTMGRSYHGNCSKSLTAKVPGKMLQVQAVLRFAMGCQDTRVDRTLIESPLHCA